MGKYLSIIGMFVIGIVIVITGVYFFMAYSATPEAMEYQAGVVLMLIGLLVTGVGAIKGKRMMRSVGYFAAYPPDTYSRPAQVAPAQPKPPAVTQPPGPRPTPLTPVNQPKPSKAPQEKQPPKVVKVLVCPKCGSENQVMDSFCFNCGKKLRPKKSAKSA